MTTLDSITTEIVDCEHKTAPAGDGYAYAVGTKAMKGGRIVLEQCRPVSAETYSKWARRAVPEAGDLVLAREAPVGEVVRLPGSPRFCLGQRTVLIKPDSESVNGRFLHYWLQGASAQHLMHSIASGATTPHLNVGDIRNLSIESMPRGLEVQRVVGAILGSIDDLIENNRRRIEVLEEMAQAIYREWFVHFRFPGHENTTFVDSPLGPIPESWHIRKASEVLVINPRTKSLKEVEDPFFTMADISERSLVCFPSEMKNGTSGSKFLTGDTLFARITPCLENGKTGYVAALGEGQVGRGSTEFIVLRGSLVGSCFTYCLARDTEFRGHAIASMSGASGRQRVRNECFDSYELAVPSSDLVDQFERLASPMIEQAFSAARQNQSLAEARNVLLPKLVTGEIDVSELDLDGLVGGL